MEGLLGTIQIEEEESERLLTSLLRAMYTSELSIESTEDIVPLLLLAKKYEVTTWIQQLEDDLSRNIDACWLQCIHLDSEHAKVKEAFQMYVSQYGTELLENKSYMSLNEEQLGTMLTLLVNDTNQIQGINAVQSWINHNEEERGGYSNALCELVRSANTPAPIIPILNDVMFQPEYCGISAQISSCNRKIKKIR
jgi:hypothetical protein